MAVCRRFPSDTGPTLLMLWTPTTRITTVTKTDKGTQAKTRGNLFGRNQGLRGGHWVVQMNLRSTTICQWCCRRNVSRVLFLPNSKTTMHSPNFNVQPLRHTMNLRVYHIYASIPIGAGGCQWSVAMPCDSFCHVMVSLFRWQGDECRMSLAVMRICVERVPTVVHSNFSDIRHVEPLGTQQKDMKQINRLRWLRSPAVPQVVSHPGLTKVQNLYV